MGRGDENLQRKRLAWLCKCQYKNNIYMHICIYVYIYDICMYVRMYVRIYSCIYCCKIVFLWWGSRLYILKTLGPAWPILTNLKFILRFCRTENHFYTLSFVKSRTPLLGIVASIYAHLAKIMFPSHLFESYYVWMSQWPVIDNLPFHILINLQEGHVYEAIILEIQHIWLCKS